MRIILREPIDAAPFIAWVDSQVELLANDPVNWRHETAGSAVRPDGHSLLADRIRMGGSWLRKGAFRSSGLIERALVEDALTRAGALFADVYPELAARELAAAVGEEAYCWACRAFVATIEAACAWCDERIVDIDLSGLPPRHPALAVAPPPDPGTVVRHRPRVRKGRPFYLDVLPTRKREVLETFAATARIQEAARVAAPGLFSSADSAANAVRTLLVREGWYEPTGARGGHATPELKVAAERVRRALDDGAWNRVPPDVPSPSQRRVFDERTLRDAAWLYLYDEQSFGQIAERLIARTTAGCVSSLKSALIDEWNRRGWPRRTTRSAHRGYQPPTGRRRCTGHRPDGARCKRWATAGKHVCFDHDADRMAERVARNVAASRVANADAVPLEPWRWWLRRRAAPAAGSIVAIHRRIDGAVSYDTLAEWAKLRPRGGAPKVLSVRRSTIDRVLAAWGDGTTFEDIYLPVSSDDEDLVPAEAA